MQLYKGLVPAKYAQRVPGAGRPVGGAAQTQAACVFMEQRGISVWGADHSACESQWKGFSPGIAPAKSLLKVLYHLVAFPDLK